MSKSSSDKDRSVEPKEERASEKMSIQFVCPNDCKAGATLDLLRPWEPSRCRKCGLPLKEVRQP